ncbi:hypothetical protein [Absidia glauca]|uniref:Major facilitator superfamily (MFS) profile domain-containing protein n=1 Tax=Absidia glauca TaxID=4829 RepID=A0A168N2P4_ABSGL|nr:hypothetical protein [Absidia glauca]
MEERKKTDNLSLQSDATLDVDDTASYPPVLEIAPFPTLASLNEITTTLSRRSQHATKGMNDHSDLKGSGMESGAKVEDDTFLEPLDEGWKSKGWLVVLSTFLVNFSVFGYCFCWGNFQKLYLQPDVYGTETSAFKIAFVGTSASACMMSLGLFISPVIMRLGYRRTMCIGTVVAPLGLILASFATQLWHIYLSQGILFGLGATFVFSPSIGLPSQWFVKRRAFATGIAVSGSGIGGVCLSPMSQQLIEHLGYRNALRVLGATMFGLLCISTALAMSRFKPSPSGRPWYALVDRSLLGTQFNLLFLFSLLVPFGYIAPFFLMPTYAASIGVDSTNGAALVSIMSATNAICRIVLGYLGDRFGRLNIMFFSTFLSAYAILFGLSGGAFVSMIPSVTADIVGIANIQTGLGMSYAATTIGNLMGTPISGLLQTQYGWTAAIQWCGAITMSASVVALVLRMVRADYKLYAKV